MKSIKQHEADRQAAIPRRGPVPCGIGCPNCGRELWSDPSIVLTTNPPRKPVHCFGCNWSGSVTA